MNEILIESLTRYIGQTVTIFTESGGISGSGFTGTLAGIFGCNVRLITHIGMPPACPVGSACLGEEFYNNWGGAGFIAPINNGPNYGGGCGCGCGCGCGGGCGGGNNNNNYFGYNWLGSVCEIPLHKIVCFTHTAI